MSKSVPTSLSNTEKFYKALKAYFLSLFFNSKSVDLNCLESFESAGRLLTSKLFQDTYKPTNQSMEEFIRELSSEKSKKFMQYLKPVSEQEEGSVDAMRLLELLQRIDNLVRLNRPTDAKNLSNVSSKEFSRELVVTILKDIYNSLHDDTVTFNESCNYFIPSTITLTRFATYAFNIFLYLIIHKIMGSCYQPNVREFARIIDNDAHLRHMLAGLSLQYRTESKHLTS